MRSAPAESLDAWRERLRAARSATALAEIVAALRADPRSGAKEICARAEQRLASSEADALRLRGLLARRSALRAAGARFVAGVDEVGVGPLAGPVVAAAVVLPDEVVLPGLDDSKRLDAATRERLDAAIREQALAVSVAEVSPQEIDRLNVLRASLVAMRCAVEGLAVRADHVLVDARTIPDLLAPQTAIIHGDATDATIAAASIVAKVHRDAVMKLLDGAHPGYGFAVHKGYPTPAHRAALARLGPSPVHRRSFAPVAACGATA
jgi:ribonuclease HII